MQKTKSKEQKTKRNRHNLLRFASNCQLLLPLLLLTVSCSPPLRTEPFFPEKKTEQGGKTPRLDRSCGDWRNYVPDLNRQVHLSMRYLRVNFHIMNSSDSSRNFKPHEARPYFKKMLELANAQLDSNVQNWRSPTGTAVLPRLYRYVIVPQPSDDGFYFHYDDSLYYYVSQGQNQNNYSRKVIEKYAIGKDSIVNVFIMVHHDDSIKSPTYRANGQGIALGTALKMAVIYDPNAVAHAYVGVFNHEVGHVLGLSHAWLEDGCPDTDNHANKCWVLTKDPPCNEQATNNMMDYNAYQIALTPCQIGRIQAVFANERSPLRRCLVPTWCERNPAKDLIVRDSSAWEGARDLEGNLTVAPGGSLRIFCRVSMPAGGRITVQPGGRLWLDGARLHNACGKTWEGIFVQEKGDLRGEVHTLKPSVLENCPQEKSKK